ncbi:MAG: hypothetical protein Q9216_002761 [Gyalolechia sp. 2 TL-2023]
MSRHKLVKTMDLDDELDNFDGVDYEVDYDGGDDPVTAEDKARLQQGLVEVRAVLGPSIPVSDKDIEDSLWHYYYDVEKTVNYLLQQKSPVGTKKSTKKGKGSMNGGIVGLSSESTRPNQQVCPETFSVAQFFADAPWLNIPWDRQGEILIEPLYPRGGLLGGSSNQAGSKMSKLAALAAARKKKENFKPESAESRKSNSSVALLEKLTIKSQKDKSTLAEEPVGADSEVSVPTHQVPTHEVPSAHIRKYVKKRRRSSQATPTPSIEAPDMAAPSTCLQRDPVQDSITPSIPMAAPSMFARIIFSSNQDPKPLLVEPFRPMSFSLPQSNKPNTKSDPFLGPSPDDIVTKAQSSSKGAKAAKTTVELSKDEAAANEMSRGVADVTIDGGPKTRSKHLDVLAEFQKSGTKQAANFVVIGHVDAGKSTLMGRLLYDLKVVDQRTIDKYRREAERIGKSSFALAWVLDQGTEERNRGVTIDIATNKFETTSTSFTILDAPGHRDFIPNMIAGASQADFAVLVIDASTGSFESGLKGQTKEHALLVRSMGVQRIVVAVNKLDTVQWSKDRFDEIRQQLSAFLTTAGFQSKNVAFVPCSGLTGDNITRRTEAQQASWYDGPVLIEQLEASDHATRALDKPLRLSIADIFRGGMQNPLSISGRLESGTLQVGDRIIAMPANETATIKGIEVDFEPADWAVAGQNVILHLTDIEQKHLKPGDVICPPSAPIKNMTVFTVKILAFDHITPMQVEVHRGRLQIPGRITQLMAVLDKSTGAAVGKKKPRLVQPGAVARISVEVESAVPLEAPGRVVLRAGGETVAAGLVDLERESTKKEPPARDREHGIRQNIIFKDEVPQPKKIGWFKRHILRAKPDTGPEYLMDRDTGMVERNREWNGKRRETLALDR